MPASPLPRLQAFPTEDLAFRRYVADAFAAVVADVETRPDAILEPEELQLAAPRTVPGRRRAPPGDARRTRRRRRPVVRLPLRVDRAGHPLVGGARARVGDPRRRAAVRGGLDVADLDRGGSPRGPARARRGGVLEPDDESAGDDVRALWGEFLERGELHSTLRFRRLDGTEREIEYHVTREGAGPGRHLAVVREIERA